MSLPVFPTQDGGIHLYYVNVIGHLLSGDARFGAFYFLRHPLPPYIVHYALLLALTHFLTPAIAEKCVVCLIVLLTAFGFRFLALVIGPNGALMSLWVLPLTLSWPLFMGFHNYCLALGFCLWALGIWLRAVRTRRPAMWLGFLVAVVLILFTHPIPLLLLLAAIGVELVLRILREKPGRNLLSACSRFRPDLAVAGLACASLAYIALFMDKANAAHVLANRIPRVEIASALLRLRWMCFATGGIGMVLYRCGLYSILLLGFLLASRDLRLRWQRRNLDARDALLICGVVLALALPLLPPNMNGSEHFSDRLPIFVWITVLAAAGANRRLTVRSQVALAALAALFALTTLGLANHFIRPVAFEISSIEKDPIAQHKIGLLFDASAMIADDRITFDPYLRWVGGRYFRRADAVLLNDPWVSPPFPLPLRRMANPLTAHFSALDFQDPVTLHQSLINCPEERMALLSSIDLMLFVGTPKPGALAPDPLLAMDSSRRWNCKQSPWYLVCEANPKLITRNNRPKSSK